MQNDKKVKDIMTGIFDYPHIPYWFSIGQAIRIVNASFIKPKKYPNPLVILVFNEKYNLLGTISLKNILQGLEPKLYCKNAKVQVDEKNTGAPRIEWDALFDKEAKEVALRQVSEIMVPIEKFVQPEDPIKKAAHIMLSHDAYLLPVLENKKKLVGIIRIIELFEEISNSILKE